MEYSWHVAATNIHSIKIPKRPETDDQSQCGVHLACSNRLTNCQWVRDRWPGSVWSPPGMHQQTYPLSMCQRKMTRVSMEPTRHASTDLPAVNGSETDDQGQCGVHQACSNRLTPCQWVRDRWPGSVWSPPGMQQQTYPLSMGQRQMTRVSIESTRHAATDLPTVNGSETDDQGQHGVHQACSNRLTACQWVRDRWPGSVWSPPSIQQTYQLSMGQRQMTWVSMESTRHAPTDLLPVNGSETDDQGQHGVHQACSNRLTPCQWVRDRWPGSAWSPPGMQQQTYPLSMGQMDTHDQGQHGVHQACSNRLTGCVNGSETDDQGQRGVHQACSNRLTVCQWVRDRWPGSAWSPPGMQQQTYCLSMGQRQMTRVSVESTRHAPTDLLPVRLGQRQMTRVSRESTCRHAATDLPPVSYGSGDRWPGSAWSPPGMHSLTFTHCHRVRDRWPWVSVEVYQWACTNRLTPCQWVRDRWSGSAWRPPGVQQQTYQLSMGQRQIIRISCFREYYFKMGSEQNKLD